MIESGKVGSAVPKPILAAFRRTATLSLVLGVGLLLGACSTMSDVGEATTDGVSTVANALNPFNWFDESEEDDATERAKQNRSVANTQPKSGPKSAPRDALAQRSVERDEERYPKLSSVPERPREAISKRADKAREELREGLIADTANAEYTDNELRAQTGGTAASTQADSARSNERISGEPKAMAAPRLPVAAEPVAPVAPVARVSAPSTPTASSAPKAVAAATPRVAPPPVAPASATQRRGYDASQAAAASAAPVAALAPEVKPAPLARQAPRPASGKASAPAPQRQAALSEPATAPVDPQPRSVLKTIQVATIYFNDGSSHLSSNDKRVVDQVAAAARRTGGLLRIIGHSSMAAAGRDAERAAMVNYKVSLERANAVAVELLRHGIPGNQMQVMAEGARNPIYAESSATGAAGNRRTEIYLDFYERL